MLLMLFLLFQTIAVIVDLFYHFYPASLVAHIADPILFSKTIAVIADPFNPFLFFFLQC